MESETERMIQQTSEKISECRAWDFTHADDKRPLHKDGWAGVHASYDAAETILRLALRNVENRPVLAACFAEIAYFETLTMCSLRGISTT